MSRYTKVACEDGAVLVIGSGSSCDIRYDSDLVAERHASIGCEQEGFVVSSLARGAETRVNREVLGPLERRRLAPGDTLRIAGLTIAVGAGFLSIAEVPGLVVWPRPGIELLTHAALLRRHADIVPDEGEPVTFLPSPRLVHGFPGVELSVDGPPARAQADEQPIALQLGPSLAMALTSVIMAAVSFSRLVGGAELLSTLPTLSMALAMVASSLVWPPVARVLRARRVAEVEARRSQLYVAYLDGVERRLVEAAHGQAQALRERRVGIDELARCAAARGAHGEAGDDALRVLMNRTASHDDFLELRVGVGEAPLHAKVTWPERHFSLDDDRMLDRVAELSAELPRLRDVPLPFSPVRHQVAGVIGERGEAWAFVRGLVAQACALHSYRDVKVAFVGESEERSQWEPFVSLGHLYDGRSGRLVALSESGVVALDRLLCRELDRRGAAGSAYELADGPFYLVVCSSGKLAQRSSAVRRVLARRPCLGISLLFLGRCLGDLPRECGLIMDLSPERPGGLHLAERGGDRRMSQRGARMFERDDVAGSLAWFDPDISLDLAATRSLARDLSRLRLQDAPEASAPPDSCGLLAALGVCERSQLDIAGRWWRSDASQSLVAPIGVGADGEAIMLDFHEGVHGPHGLVAGTTGSGKSELLVSLVAALAANYAPEEVAFLLIDYKGGGLADAFEREGRHLPHLAGTVTNLDGASARRSLVALAGELRRRQELFREARRVTGESSMDIYRYLSCFRQGLLALPCPHLVVIADEFAELKDQQPAFMDELVSAARIGRSLGVHLVLATQKPSGVVDEQIWSNARFKICLKVADAADSREMIRTDAAAEVSQVGRFYMLVGYNESLALGQAAWGGAAYVARDRLGPERDLAVELLGPEGQTLARLQPQRAADFGETELDVLLSAVADEGARQERRAQQLWLPPLPARLTLSELDGRSGSARPDGLVATVGLVDDPERRRQERLDVDLASLGNALLVGPQGSGVEELACTMAVSLAEAHRADELWLYAVDLGTGALAPLAGLPQCGGIVRTGDDERLAQLFRLLARELAVRRAAGTRVNGNSDRARRRVVPGDANEGLPIDDAVVGMAGDKRGSRYRDGAEAWADRASAGEMPPRIVVVLANLAALEELAPELAEELVALTRDGAGFGLHFVVSVGSPASVRLRLRANFGIELPVMLPEAAEYASVLGSLGDAPCPHQRLRGLVRQEGGLLEFQGATLGVDRVSAESVVSGIARHAGTARAPAIPQLPERVTAGLMPAPAKPKRLPVGFDRLAVEPVWLDLDAHPQALVLGNDAQAIARHLSGALASVPGSQLSRWRVIDVGGLLGSPRGVPAPSLVRDEASMAGLMDELEHGAEGIDVLVLVGVAQLMSTIGDDLAGRIGTWLAGEGSGHRPPVVAAEELWRTRALYQDWWKALSALGSGVWVGGGFAEQSVLAPARMRPQWGEPCASDDGFLILRGAVTPVRLVVLAEEPAGARGRGPGGTREHGGESVSWTDGKEML